MAKVMVTGAHGFTGRYLCDLLASKNFEVHGLVHQVDPAIVQKHFVGHECNLSDLSRLTRIVTDIRPDYLIHLAAISFVPHGNVEEIYQTNLLGTRNLLEAFVRAGCVPTSILVASSANVYGNRVGGQISEECPLDPVNDYAISKVASEYILKLYANELPIICVRPFNYTGVGQSELFLIPKMVSHARARAPIISLGNLDTARDFSDVRAVAMKYLRLMNTPDAIGQTFNVCSGTAYSLREILEMVTSLAGHDMMVEVDPSLVRPNEVKQLWGNPIKLNSIISGDDDIPLEHTIQWMLGG
jgi:nucleoside-diphosphate-sugar epimerase